MKKELRESGIFFSLLAVVYIFFSAGHIDTIDADASVELAKSILSNSSLSVHPTRRDPMIYVTAENGNTYSKMGLASALIYLPMVFLEKAFNFLSLSPSDSPNVRLLPFLISMVNPLLAAFIVALLYWYLKSLSKSKSESTVICLLVAFGTFLWPYSKTCQREILQACCLLGSFVFPTIFKKERSNVGFVLAGIFFGFGILTKLTFVLFLLPLFLVLLHSQASRKNLCVFFLSVIPFILIHLAYSYHCFGAFSGTGYSKDVVQFQGGAWSTPFWTGIWKQTFDWKTGFFFYNPLLILLIPFIFSKLIKRRWTQLDSAIALASILQLSIHARWWSPTGDNALGPRFLVVLIPILALWLELPVLFFRSPIHKSLRTSFVIFCVLCISFQLVQTSIKSQLYWTLASKSAQKLNTPQWLANFIILKQKIKSDAKEYDLRHFGGDEKIVNLSKNRSYAGFNFWWGHLWRYRKENWEQKNFADDQRPPALWNSPS